MSGKKKADNGEPKIVETKADKFRRLVNKRLGKFVKLASQVQNTANRATYEYTDEQAEIVMNTCRQAVVRICDAFNRPARVADSPIDYV